METRKRGGGRAHGGGTRERGGRARERGGHKRDRGRVREIFAHRCAAQSSRGLCFGHVEGGLPGSIRQVAMMSGVCSFRPVMVVTLDRTASVL